MLENKNLNVLFLVSSISPSEGGIERVTSILSSFFLQNGLDVYYFFYNIDDENIDQSHKCKFDLSWDGEKFELVYKNFILENNINIIINQDLNFLFISNFYKKIKLYYPDIYIIDCIHNPPDFYRLKKHSIRNRIKDTLYRIIYGYSLYSELWRKMYDSVDICILLSKTFLPKVKSEFGKSRMKKMYVISNPLSFELKGHISFLSKKKQFLIVARLDDHQKNIKSALSIWKFFEQARTDYVLKLAGYGKDEAEILNYAKSLQLKNFEFIGKVENPQYLYKESRFFMMTSRYEGFGMTLVEAQQYGCIPFAFDTYSALHDIIKSNYNGFIIRKNNKKEYVRTMKHVIQMSLEELSKISHNCYISSKKFSIDKIGIKWLELFDQVNNI